ncbi:hypothetical protein C7972_104153 [Arenibacter sp. ARW7G5Y1]|nr:hypothetical protein C7972_104153 [Arenibacter sp. ARW7G5Y1]
MNRLKCKKILNFYQITISNDLEFGISLFLEVGKLGFYQKKTIPPRHCYVHVGMAQYSVF